MRGTNPLALHNGKTERKNIMKKSFKILSAALAAITVMSCTSTTAFADKIKTIDGVRYLYSDSGENKGKYTGWAKTSKGKRYYNKGIMCNNRWLKTQKGKYYYAGNDGYMRTGWAKVSRGKGNYSYFNKNGVWDGKVYYTGYQPQNLYSFFLDYDLLSAGNLVIGYSKSGISLKNADDFTDTDILQQILKKDLYTETITDLISGDEIELSDELFHGGRCITIKSRSDNGAYLEFTKDSAGDSYVYNGYFGFGLKLKDKMAFEKLSQIIDKYDDVEESLEDDEKYEEENSETLHIEDVINTVEKTVPAEIFGGIYDMNGIITVLSTDTDTAENIIEKLYPYASNITVRECNFSLKYLTKVKNTILKKRTEFDIGVCTDVINNKVVIDGMSISDKLKKFIEDSGFSDCVRYEITNGEDIDD